MNTNEIENISCETALSLIHDAPGSRPELSKEEEVRMRAHLDGCEECRREYERLREMTALIAASAYDAPPTLRDSVLSEIRANRKAAANRRRLIRSFGTIAAAFAVVIGIFAASRLGGFDKAMEMEANMAADADFYSYSTSEETATDRADAAYPHEDGAVPEAETTEPMMKMAVQSTADNAMGMRDDSAADDIVEEPAVEEIVVEEPVVEEAAPVMEAPMEEAPPVETDSTMTSGYSPYGKTGDAVIITSQKPMDKTPFTKKYMPKGESLILVESIVEDAALAESETDAPLLWIAVQELQISRKALETANRAFANDPGVSLTDGQIDALLDPNPAAAREAFANTWALCVKSQVYPWEMLCAMDAAQMQNAGITASRLRIYMERMADVFLMICGNSEVYSLEFGEQMAHLSAVADALGATYAES